MPKTKPERHLDICKEINDLYAKKNHDYGDSFHQTFVEEGFAMSRIRLSDKFNRFKTLSRGTEAAVKDESIRDTLIDLANYAIMTVLEMDDAKNKNSVKKVSPFSITTATNPDSNKCIYRVGTFCLGTLIKAYDYAKTALSKFINDGVVEIGPIHRNAEQGDDSFFELSFSAFCGTPDVLKEINNVFGNIEREEYTLSSTE